MASVGMARDSGRTVRPKRLAGAVAGIVAAAGLSVVPMSGASAAADPGMSVVPMPVGAVPLAQAGELAMWGPFLPDDPHEGQTTVPASLADVAVTQVAVSDSVTLALTAAGRVVSFGANSARVERLPDAVKAAKVAQIAVDGNDYAGAVTRDGRVLTWGRKTSVGSPLDVPAGLSGVKQLAISSMNAVALKNDGSVVAWGKEPAINAPPSGLTATAITTSYNAVFALTTSGTVKAWGSNADGELTLPASVKQDGNVKAVAAFNNGAIALLTNDTLVSWGGTWDLDTPAWLASLDPVSITGSYDYLGVVDSDGVIHQRSTYMANELPLPAELNGRPLATFEVAAASYGGAVITKMLRGDDPAISGTATVGSTLTATPGTFSASPTTVTSEWLADGTAIPGASGTTLTLTAAQLGKTITYKSTATKAGETTVSSTSAAVTVTNPPPPPPPAPVASTTKVLSVKVAKKAASVKVTGKVTAAKPVTGKATVTIKKGKKTIVAKAVKVSVKGAVTLTVKKFGKLAIKKTKSKSKTGYRGGYTVTISYAGNTQVKPSKASKNFKVK